MKNSNYKNLLSNITLFSRFRINSLLIFLANAKHEQENYDIGQNNWFDLNERLSSYTLLVLIKNLKKNELYLFV